MLDLVMLQAMEVDEKPSEEYSDIGGCDKQINELIEAVVLPMTHVEMFSAIGIRPPKGVLLHGPPGTGKTLLARACAKQTDAIFLKLAGPQLVQMFIGDGAKLVRDAFELAKEKVKSGGFLPIHHYIAYSQATKVARSSLLMSLMQLVQSASAVSSPVIVKYNVLCWSF